MRTQSDATPACRGYRLQALYTLARVLEQRGNNDALVFQPEDKENLAVRDADQKLLEIVQVEERSSNPTLSSFEPEKPESFFYRVAAELKADSDVRITIVALGDVGPELDKAIKEDGDDRARAAQKIAAHKHLPETEAEWVGAAEALFWAGRWGVRWPSAEWLPEAELDGDCGALPLDSLADLVIGVVSVNGDGDGAGDAPYEDWLGRNREVIVNPVPRRNADSGP